MTNDQLSLLFLPIPRDHANESYSLVNFDPEDFRQYIQRAIALREHLKSRIAAVKTPPAWSDLANFQPAVDLVEQGRNIEYDFISKAGTDKDIFSLKLTVLYGLKGVAAYAFHAAELDQHDDRIYASRHYSKRISVVVAEKTQAVSCRWQLNAAIAQTRRRSVN